MGMLSAYKRPFLLSFDTPIDIAYKIVSLYAIAYIVNGMLKLNNFVKCDVL
jgi:hypothetical protein